MKIIIIDIFNSSPIFNSLFIFINFDTQFNLFKKSVSFNFINILYILLLALLNISLIFHLFSEDFIKILNILDPVPLPKR